MNTKICAILFAGATLAGNEGEVISNLKPQDNKGFFGSVKNVVVEGTKKVVKGTKKVFSNLSEDQAAQSGDANERTEKLRDLVQKVQAVIKTLQAPAAGCDERSEDEKKEVQTILQETVATVVESIKKFEKNLPESARRWMDNAKTALTNFQQTITGQPNEDEIKALLEELDIEGLKAVAKDVKADDKVSEADKQNIKLVQDIVTPLEKATDIGSLLSIIHSDCLPQIERLETEQYNYFINAADNVLDKFPKVIKHLKCGAPKEL